MVYAVTTSEREGNRMRSQIKSSRHVGTLSYKVSSAIMSAAPLVASSGMPEIAPPVRNDHTAGQPAGEEVVRGVPTSLRGSLDRHATASPSPTRAVAQTAWSRSPKPFLSPGTRRKNSKKVRRAHVRSLRSLPRTRRTFLPSRALGSRPNRWTRPGPLAYAGE